MGGHSKKVLFVCSQAESLGVEYLSAILKRAGHETDLLFEFGLGEHYIGKTSASSLLKRVYNFEKLLLKKAKAFNPDLIAMSCLNSTTTFTLRMAESLKAHLNVPIVVGGMQATFAPTTLLSSDAIDMVCIGEGEYALLELVDNLGSERDTSIRNIWFKETGNIVRNGLRPLIQDLDLLPYPDKEPFYKYGAFQKRLYVMASRGCPHSCTYCFNGPFRKLYPGQRYVRLRHPRAVIKEIEFFIGKYQMTEVYFLDDDLLINKDWAKTLCREYKEHIGLPFYCHVHPLSIDDELVKSVKEAGCTHVFLGLESGNAEMRSRVLGRAMTNGQIMQAAEHLHKHNLTFTTLNMIGFPSETKEQMLDTVRLNRVLKPHSGRIALLFPFPGHEISSLTKNEAFLQKTDAVLSGSRDFYDCSLSDLNDEELGIKILYYFPFLVRYPFLAGVLKWLPPLGMVKTLSVLFDSPWRNTAVRLREHFNMHWKMLKDYAVHM